MASFPTPREPFLDHRLQASLTRRGMELLGAAFVGMGVSLALILFSYSPQDPGWMAATDDPVQNALGRVGAAVAAPLVIIAGKAGWGLVLALTVWGARLILHRGEGAILARGVFLPVAVALSAVWAASLVPGRDWQQEFGLGGMFGDTVLGALLSALPIASTFGFNILTLLLFAAMMVMWFYVLATSLVELRALGQFLLTGVILTFAGLRALLVGGLRGTGRGAARLAGSVAGGIGAMRSHQGTQQADHWGQHPEPALQAAWYQGHDLADGQAMPRQPAMPTIGAHRSAWHQPAGPQRQEPRMSGPGAPAARGGYHAEQPLQSPLTADPYAQPDWAPHHPEAAAQRVARVVRAGTSRAQPSAFRPAPEDHDEDELFDPASAQWGSDPYAVQPDFARHAQPTRRQVTPAARDFTPPYSSAPARAPEPVPTWGQPAGRSLLSRVSALGRRPLAQFTANDSADLLPELVEPPLTAAHVLPNGPPQPERIRSRISDLLRNRDRAKPVLRFDPEAPPAPRHVMTTPGLRPEPRLSGGPAHADPFPATRLNAPLENPVASVPKADPAQTVAPHAPATPTAGGLFGLLPGFGWTAPVQASSVAMPEAIPAAKAPSAASVQPAATQVSAPFDNVQGLDTGYGYGAAEADIDGQTFDEDPYGAPPAPRSGGVYNRRVVQQQTRKPPAPSARARAEAEPRLPLEPTHPDYELPPLALLSDPRMVERYTLSDEALEENARMLESVLDDYGVRGEIVAVRPGPVVTLYELEPAPGLKASRVIGLADDIARSMSALSARVSTVPGRSVIGIELPNARREKVLLREILASRDFDDSSLRLPLALGKDIGGESIVANLAKMPHLLIAGTTGSGKSVAINTMILSLLYKLTPAECRLIMIDPKMLELSVYDGIPHLLSPVVTDPKKAVTALKWVVAEMEERYRRMSKMGVRNIEGYNGRVREAQARGEMFKRTIQTGFDDETGDPVFETEEFLPELLPFIVVVVDEMADLMMVAGKEIEACIQRLAQMARASGIHLIMATQRPSVDVITGTIKANFPTRISFQVTSKIDSRTILGEMGAEQLLGMGDMLYMAGGSKITRIHGPFVSDEEVEEIVNHLKSFGPPSYETGVLEGPDGERESEIDAVLGLGDGSSSEDALYDQAVAIVARDRKCSTSYIQRKLGIGYNKAARLVEQMEDQGVVSRANQVGKREILVPEG